MFCHPHGNIWNASKNRHIKSIINLPVWMIKRIDFRILFFYAPKKLEIYDIKKIFWFFLFSAIYHPHLFGFNLKLFLSKKLIHFFQNETPLYSGSQLQTWKLTVSSKALSSDKIWSMWLYLDCKIITTAFISHN